MVEDVLIPITRKVSTVKMGIKAKVPNPPTISRYPIESRSLTLLTESETIKASNGTSSVAVVVEPFTISPTNNDC